MFRSQQLTRSNQKFRNLMIENLIDPTELKFKREKIWRTKNVKKHLRKLRFNQPFLDKWRSSTTSKFEVVELRHLSNNELLNRSSPCIVTFQTSYPNVLSSRADKIQPKFLKNDDRKSDQSNRAQIQP